MDKKQNERETYLQWKSDSWRNTAIMLRNAIISENKGEIDNAMKMFEQVRKQFPFADGGNALREKHYSMEGCINKGEE